LPQNQESGTQLVKLRHFFAKKENLIAKKKNELSNLKTARWTIGSVPLGRKTFGRTDIWSTHTQQKRLVDKVMKP
jgi:hypothetical protein